MLINTIKKSSKVITSSRNTSKGSLSRNKTRAVKYKFGHLFAEIDKSKDDNSCKSHFSLYKNSRDCNKELDRETQEVDEILEDSNMQCHIEARMDTSPRDNPAILKLIPHLASLGSNNVRQKVSNPSDSNLQKKDRLGYFGNTSIMNSSKPEFSGNKIGMKEFVKSFKTLNKSQQNLVIFFE